VCEEVSEEKTRQIKQIISTIIKSLDSITSHQQSHLCLLMEIKEEIIELLAKLVTCHPKMP